MSYVSSRKSGSLGGLTLPEMVIALAIAGIVFAVILPQLRVIQNSWDSREGASETLQNGRVLMDHLHRNLSRAARITAVSGPSETDGHIEFQASDGNNMRYDIAGDNYVEFGIVGSLADLAGPVSRLQFTCYNAFDLTTPVTDVNSIRCVKVQATLTNPAAMDQDMSFTTQAYIRTNALPAAGGDISKKSEPWPEFDPASGKTPALCRIDSTHYLCAYGGEGDDGWAVVLTVNSDDRSVTAETPFEFDTSNGLEPALARLDDTHFLCAYRGDGDDGWVVVLTVNTANWTISAETPFEYDAADGWTPALSRIDDQHFLCAYEGPGTDGWAVALTVDTGNWTITAETPFEFDVTKCTRPALAAIDDNYFLCAYQGDGDDGWAVVLRILPGYGVSAEIPFEFDTVDGRAPALFPIDNEHYLCVYEGDGSDGWAQVLAVDPVVKSITGGTPFEFDVADGRTPSLSRIDGSQYLCAYEGSGSDGWAVVLTVDTGTWTISAETPFEFDSGTGTEPALVELSDGRHVCSYQGAGDDGYAGVLEISEGVLP